jgi:ABC-type transport system substrate-binding protein
MTVKRLLILVPCLIVVILLQSYFWVPTYEEQTRGNPQRLNTFITASIGDASLLNPVLSAESASSQIETLVFEGLLDRDENLNFRGRVARKWEIYEEAYFYVNESFDIPGRGRAGAEEVAALIRDAKQKGADLETALRASLARVKNVETMPPRSYDATIPADVKGEQTAGGVGLKVHVSAPARIKLTLEEVDQDLFENLASLLGKRYFESFRPERYVKPETDVDPQKLSAMAGIVLPVVEHNPVLVFHLRPGVKFHDGHEVEARDVRFTYEAIMNPQNLSPRVSDYEPVKSVEVIDPLTVRITYKRLYSPAISSWAMGILPEHWLNPDALKKEAVRAGKDPNAFSMRQSSFNRKPLGCGPFRFEQWKSDQYIRLNRFEQYWEGPPNYHQYAFRVIPDLLTQEMEFYAGTLDSYGVQPHQVQRLEADPRFQSFSGLSFGYTYIGYNMRRKPFDDLRVRKALGMAIDVDKIIEFVLYGQGERITGPFVKQTDYYNHAIRPVPYDPEAATRLLREAGWVRNREGWLEKDGKILQFTLITNSGNDLRKAVLAIAQDAWKQIGIDVRTDLLEWSVFIQERVMKGDFDAVVLGWQMGIEPDLYQIWHSSQSHPYQLNFVGFKNEAADDLIVKIRREYDHQKQVAYCHELHEIIAREQPYTFLYVGKWTAVLDKRIVIRERDKAGHVVYKKITPTKTGDYTFYFNKWIKLPEAPVFNPEG